MRFSTILLSISQFFILSIAHSQDVHWSQINQIQSFQNPSCIGEYEEDIKFTVALKDQWRNVTKPYQTYFAAIDTKLRKTPWLSLGCNLLKDVTGDGSLNTNQINFISRVDKNINSRITLAFGIDLGLTNKNIDFTKFKFDNQYDGFKFNNTILSNESYSNSSIFHPTIGAGFSSNYIIKKNQNLSLGFSIYNLNKPKEGFYNIEIIRPVRTVYFIHYIYKYNRHSIISSLNYEKQDAYQKILVGLLDNIKTKNIKIKYVHTGFSMRYLDAFIIHLGISSINTKVIISYDVNTSKLNIASNGRGSLELNIQYLIKKKPLKYTINPSCIDYF